MPHVRATEDVEPEVADHGGRAHDRDREDRAVGGARIAERGPLLGVLGTDRVLGVDEDAVLAEDLLAPPGEATDGQRGAGVDVELGTGGRGAVGADRRRRVVRESHDRRAVGPGVADDRGQRVLDRAVELAVERVHESGRDRCHQLATGGAELEREPSRVDLGHVTDGDDEGPGSDARQIHRLCVADELDDDPMAVLVAEPVHLVVAVVLGAGREVGQGRERRFLVVGMDAFEPEGADQRTRLEAEHALDRRGGGQDRPVVPDQAHAVDRVLEHERHERLVDRRGADLEARGSLGTWPGATRGLHETNIDPSVPILRVGGLRSARITGLHGGPTTVDREHLAGHVAARSRAQEQERAVELVLVPRAAGAGSARGPNR